MAEYIDKQALITEIQSAVSMVLQTAPYEKVWFDRFVDRQNEIMAIIERQPAACGDCPSAHFHPTGRNECAEYRSMLINGGQAPQREDV